MPQAIGFALFQIGAPLFVVNAAVGIGVAGTILHTAVSLAVSVGLSYLIGVLSRPSQAATAPSEGQIEIKQPVPPRIFHYGELAYSGFIGFYESHIGVPDPEFFWTGGDPVLFKLNLLQAREASSFLKIRLDDFVVTLDANGFVTQDRYGGDDDGLPQVRMSLHLGEDDQLADEILLQDFGPSAPLTGTHLNQKGAWTTAHRLRGIAYVVSRFGADNLEAYSRMFPNRDPVVNIVGRWAKVYDPRQDTTVGGSGSHRHNNKNTWEWSPNPALAVLDFLTHEDGYNRDVSRFDLDSFMTMANICGQPVELKNKITGPNSDVSLYLGSPFGDMTLNGGLAAALDRQNDEPNTSCATRNNNDGYVGTRHTHRVVFGQAIVRGSNNHGFVSSANPSVTLRIFGKNTLPANATDGTLLGTLTFTDTNDESSGRTIPSNGNTTPWEYLWVTITHTGAISTINIAEVSFFAGGTESRYRLATTVMLTEKRTDVLSRLLEACDATLQPTADGKWKIIGGRWLAPTVTINSDSGHILRADFSAGTSALDKYNSLEIKYMSVPHDYTEVEGQPWENTDDADFIAGRIETRPLDLFQVPSHGQARRLAKLRMARDNPKWIATIETNYYGLNLVGERCVQVIFPELGIDLPFWIEALEMKSDGTGVIAKIRSADPSSYDWDPESEEGIGPTVPPPIADELTGDW